MNVRKFARSAALALVLTGTLPLVHARAAGGDSATPEEIGQRVAALNAKSWAGVVANERAIDAHINVGPVHKFEQNDATVISTDGAPAVIHYGRVVKDGSVASEADLRARERRENEALAGGTGRMHRPYEKLYTGEYTFAPQACPNCRPGTIAIGFVSKVRDALHGDGSMEIDDATARLERVHYRPNILPEHAKDGDVIESFGEGAAGLWTIVAIDRTYSGRVGFFSGRGRVTERLFHYRRYSSLTEAVASCTRAAHD